MKPSNLVRYNDAVKKFHYRLSTRYLENNQTGSTGCISRVLLYASMGDDENKPRHKLSADELLEETNGTIRKIFEVLEKNGLAPDSIKHMTDMAEALDFMGTLNLARNLGLNMPDVPHEELVELLLDAWDCVVHRTSNTRKMTFRKVRLLESDNKVEPEVLERWRSERDKAERESAKARVSYVTIREILKVFKEAPEKKQEVPEEEESKRMT